ncbi:Ribonuclease P protein component 4 like [Heracleum sosnowskyi]|uniref:Ribonuclease P protein component 4 like n=1 Tax=Heracleum sosnowskyi TaxID=360622 RepID=A0AAD8GSG9_9APIA|nr:Ribonuclease P protein component 4 like [Heracleum sosnowskyi]
MGKRGLHSKGQDRSSSRNNFMTFREESLGKKQTNVSAKSMLKVQHLKNLAKWASVEASVPSLGAFFGYQLADITEGLGVPADPTMFTCQRCESILQPGSNCTVRIENDRAKVRRRKKSKAPLQNNVVYKCNFCSHRNLTRGTPRGHLKQLYPPKDKAHQKSKGATSKLIKGPISDRVDLKDSVGTEKPEAASGRDIMAISEVGTADVSKDDLNNPVTPLARTGMTLLEARSKKRNRSKPKKASESQISSTEAGETVTASNKRKRKTWTSLKEIAESGDNSNRRTLTKVPIPFFI